MEQVLNKMNMFQAFSAEWRNKWVPAIYWNTVVKANVKMSRRQSGMQRTVGKVSKFNRLDNNIVLWPPSQMTKL